MKKEELAELKEFIRREPTLRSTFEDIDAEFEKAYSAASALFKRRGELRSELAEIEKAKAKLAAEPPVADEPVVEDESEHVEKRSHHRKTKE